MQPSKLMVVFRGRHVVPPYLNHIARSDRFIVQLFNKDDMAELDFDKAMMALYGGIAVHPGPIDFIRRAPDEAIA